jgi:hypothetical protein
MHPNQLELWCPQSHLIPPVYRQLSPEQRTRLILHLSFLMLKQVRHQPNPHPTPLKTHER